jgi:hypothetical protein
VLVLAIVNSAAGTSQQDSPAWIGGHLTLPYEQKTQQSPAIGRNRAPHPAQV